MREGDAPAIQDMNAEQLRVRLGQLNDELREVQRRKVTVETDIFRCRKRLVYEFKQFDVFGDTEP